MNAISRTTVLACLLFAETGQSAERPSVLVPLADKSPALDAKSTDTGWERAATVRLDQTLGDDAGTAVRMTTEVAMLRTADALFLRFVCANPAAPHLQTRVRDRDGDVYTDESIELFIDTRDGSDYFQFVVNASGSIYDGRKFDKHWDGDWSTDVQVTDNGWVAVLAIPFATLGGPPPPGAYWLLNICRNAFDATGRAEHSTWIAPGYHRPLGLLCFGDIDARPLFQRLKEQVAKLRRFEALAAENTDDDTRIAAAVTALEARCPDPARVPPDRFAALLAKAEDLAQTMEPLMRQAVLRAILDAPNQPGERALQP